MKNNLKGITEIIKTIMLGGACIAFTHAMVMIYEISGIESGAWASLLLFILVMFLDTTVLNTLNIKKHEI